jgi:hypothetical protein
MVVLARGALVAAMIALVGAWATEFNGGAIFGLSQQHLFNDATVLALIGIAFLIDAIIHAIKDTNNPKKGIL